MSFALAVLSSTVHTVVATPVPTPSPLVVHDTITKLVTVPAVAQNLTSLAQLALLFFVGVGGSLLHQVFESLSKRPDGWSRTVNITIQFLFGLIVAALAAYVNGELKLTLDSGIAFATSLLVVLGSSQGRYMFFQWLNSLGSDKPLPQPTVEDQVDASAPIDVPVKANV